MNRLSDSLASSLIAWYVNNHNPYPWRQTADPYRVWLSEILLQQTRIPVALRYYDRILQRYPTLQSLACADERAFLSLWSGVGYYQRGKNMLRCARQIMNSHAGEFPEELDLLMALPGIGPYTAGALRNICFSKLTPAVDGNIARVLARITNNSEATGTKSFAQAMASAFMRFGEGEKPSWFFQALMELGERICLPSPACSECPVRLCCKGYESNTAHKLPAAKRRLSTRDFHWYFLVLRKAEAAYYVQNGERAFLRDAWLFPDLLLTKRAKSNELQSLFQREWDIDVPELAEDCRLRHTVTFRRITVHALTATEYVLRKQGGEWLTSAELLRYPTSSVVNKVLTILGRPTSNDIDFVSL